jgi:Fic family protein
MARKVSYNRDQIIHFISEHPLCSSQEIMAGLKMQISIATLKRALVNLGGKGIIIPVGEKKKRRYEISKSYQISIAVDLEKYFQKEIDERVILKTFNQDLIRDIFYRISIFSKVELHFLSDLQQTFKSNAMKLSKASFDLEMERLAIDLSWKSSQIEGNTYSLLETERLIKEKETASGKTRDEATMLLNHKSALDFVISQPNYLNPLTVSSIEDIHSLLVKDLNISRNIRNNRVGISGTNYTPLDNAFQIREALNEMCELINSKDNVFEKAFLTLILISYIQPFSDGNKRTARIISNGLLISHHYCPISFRTIDSIEYKKAMLVFYEQNNYAPFKKIFIDQFEFAVSTYF